MGGRVSGAPGRRRIGDAEHALILELIAEGHTDQHIARRAGVSAQTVSVRRPAKLKHAWVEVPLVIGALRHLAASDGLTADDLAARVGSPVDGLLVVLLSLGVVRRAVGEPGRYGLRKDWL